MPPRLHHREGKSHAIGCIVILLSNHDGVCQDAAVWSIKQFNGSQEYLMRAHFGLPSISAEDAREWKAPIQVSGSGY